MDLKKLTEEFPQLIEYVTGPLDQKVTSTCSIKNAQSDKLLFVHESSFLGEAMSTSCQQFVVPLSSLEEAKSLLPADRTLFVSHNVKLAKTFVSHKFFPILDNRLPFEGEQIHASAVVAKSAKIDPSVIIGPNAVIGENVIIGANSVIGASTVIEKNVTIGQDTHIFAQVLISHNCHVGNQCIIQSQTTIGSVGFGYAQNEKGESFHTPHYGKAILEDRVEIGAGVFIDRGNLDDTIIGEGTKIDNYCHFGHNFKCGKNNLITAGFIAAGSVEMGSYNVFAGRCGATGHNKLGSKMVVGANSIFTSSHEKPGKWGGYPIQPFKDYLKSQASIKHLPEMRKTLAKLVKHCGLK
ncbi:MAG: UDP-3-O-(3-hydroxymyristoyl)glucosamine N-acyltransferase [Bdellovibrionales bacterium]|nr:UDP-3-O-(3-hydroxymyristoyl)glucosamine N-acyltransferase [Bdellovibrionales bacterium]